MESNPSPPDTVLEHIFLREVLEKYNHWCARSSLLGLLAPLRASGPLESRLPPFAPREFAVVPRERLARTGPLPQNAIDLSAAVEKYGDLILLGEAGSGKTTELMRLVYDVATHGLDLARPMLPVMIRLGRYDGHRPILEFIRSELVLASKMDQTGDLYPTHSRIAAALDAYLDAGRILFLLDGLDEMPRAGYAESIHRLALLRDHYRGNRFVVSCRPAGYVLGLDLAELTIQDLNARARADLVAEIAGPDVALEDWLAKHPRLAALAGRPFWLLAIASLLAHGEEDLHSNNILPRLGCLLWEDACRRNPGREVDATIAEGALADLALAVLDERGIGASYSRAWAEQNLEHRRVNGHAESFDQADLLFLAREAGFIAEGPNRSLRFTHVIVQEYLAAIGLKRLGPDDALVRKALRDRQYDETLVQLAGAQDATQLAKQVQSLDPFLAARCLAEANNPPTRTVNALGKQLIKRVASPYRRERMRAATALGVLGVEEGIPPILALVGERDPAGALPLRRIILRFPEAQLVPYLFPLFKESDEWWRAWAVQVAGERRLKSALPHLVRLISDPNAAVRIEITRALPLLIGDGAVPYLFWLLRDRDHVVRTSAAQALIQFSTQALLAGTEAGEGNPGTPPRNEPIVGTRSQDVLISRLMALLRDNNKEVRWVAAEVLCKWQVEGLAPYLLALLNDQDPNVRWLAAQVLGRIKAHSAIPQLLALLRRPDSGLKALAVQALSRIDGPAVLNSLIPLLQDSDWYVRAVVVQNLATMNSVETPPHLINMLHDPDSYVRWLAAHALVDAHSPEAIPQLIEALGDESPAVRQSAARVLGQLGAQAAISALLPLLQDPIQEVRAAAAQALGEIHQKNVIPHLMPLLQDQNHSVRSSAAEALSKLGVTMTLPPLVPPAVDVRSITGGLFGELSEEGQKNLVILPDQELPVQTLVAQSLSQNSEWAVSHYVGLLKHEDEQVRLEAQRTLEANVRESDLPVFVPLLGDDDPRIYNAAYEIIDAVQRRLNLPKDYKISAR